MFNVNLKNKRLQNNLSQKQVADYLNISHQSVSKWENGDALPSIEYLPGLAKCLKCNIDDFFEKEKPEFFEYKALNEYFLLMSQVLDEIKTTEDVVLFAKDNPHILDKVSDFCKNLIEQDNIQTTYIQNSFNCSESEAETFLELLEACGMTEKDEGKNLYNVVCHAVEEMIRIHQV